MKVQTLGLLLSLATVCYRPALAADSSDGPSRDNFGPTVDVVFDSFERAALEVVKKFYVERSISADDYVLNLERIYADQGAFAQQHLIERSSVGKLAGKPAYGPLENGAAFDPLAILGVSDISSWEQLYKIAFIRLISIRWHHRITHELSKEEADYRLAETAKAYIFLHDQLTDIRLAKTLFPRAPHEPLPSAAAVLMGLTKSARLYDIADFAPAALLTDVEASFQFLYFPCEFLIATPPGEVRERLIRDLTDSKNKVRQEAPFGPFHRTLALTLDLIQRDLTLPGDREITNSIREPIPLLSKCGEVFN